MEKLNDWSFAARLKHRGMEWTGVGVMSLVVPEEVRCDGELRTWWAEHR